MGILEASVLALVVSVGTQYSKRLAKKIGGKKVQLLVFVLSLVAAGVWTYVKDYAPPQFLETLVVVFGLAFAWYEVILKKMKIW